MTTQVQIRGTTQATQEARTLAARELDINTTDNRINIHDGTTAGGIPHLNFADSQNQEFTFATATGTDSIAVTLARAPAAYATGQRFSFKAAATNTGSATLNVNSLGAKTIKKKGSAALETLSSGDILNGVIYTVYYDGTDMILEGGGAGGGGALVASGTFSADSSLDFTSVFTEGNNYRLEFTDIDDSGGTDLWIRFEVSSSFVTSNYAYFMRNLTGGSVEEDKATNSGGSAGYLRINQQNEHSGIAWIYNPALAISKTYFNVQSSGEDNNGGAYATSWGGGAYEVAAAVTGVQVLVSSGTIVGGTVDIFEQPITG